MGDLQYVIYYAYLMIKAKQNIVPKNIILYISYIYIIFNAEPSLLEPQLYVYTLDESRESHFRYGVIFFAYT